MRRFLIAVTFCSLSLLGFVASAGAAEPWWHLASGSNPTYLQPEEVGQIVVTATNLGDSNIEGGVSPVRIADRLPAGLKAIGISQGSFKEQSGAGCELKTLECTFTGELPPYEQHEVRIAVEDNEERATSGEVNEASISGGGARGESIAKPIEVSEESVPSGFEDNELALESEEGTLATQAGSHPFQVTSTLVLNHRFESRTGGLSGTNTVPVPAGLAKNIVVKLPPGLIGNPVPLPRCTIAQFVTAPEGQGGGGDECPPQTQIGVASVKVYEPGLGSFFRFVLPLFNLEPSYGEPARFGFYVSSGLTPVFLDTSIRSGNGEDYGVTVTSPNVSQTANFLASEITFWGSPGDPRHDGARGCGQSCPTSGQYPPSFLTLPTSCSGSPLSSSALLSSWEQPEVFATTPVTLAMPTLDGCDRLAFSPTMHSEPTTDSAASASGLNFDLYFHDEGLTSAEGLAESQLNKTVVTLPEGFTIDPSAGVGLVGCTPADYARESVDSAPGSGCPNESKLGTVEIETPLLTQKIDGNIFIAQPYENPFGEPENGHPGGTLVALYVVARNPETGVLVKLAGKVVPNPVTGRLTTIFENNPQLPFDHFNFHFREGSEAPLITPATCGTYTTTAALTPWSELNTSLTESSSFEITSGVGGGACPAGNVAPFNPGIEAGTVNNNAGAFSSLYVHLTRGDGEAEISGFSTNMPPGLTGYLTGIPFCPEADIEAARHKTGAEEEASPSCPASSEIGHSLVGTGVGAVLAYVPGKIYLAGPFDGASFSVVSITSAKVGPFDLGTVVLRFGLNINPYTAQVTVSPTSSEPIPTIIKGIVTHVRDIRVYIDRPKFIINPTSCDPLKIGSTLESNLAQRTTITSPFQNASCGNLAFSPKFAVSTSGKTSRASGASLSVKLTYPLGAVGTYANIAKVKVDLPKQLPSRLTTLQKACTAAQFNSNPAGCPAASFIGHAKAVTPLIPVPLEGPAIFVSHGGEAFPSLIMVLQGYGVTIDLVGSTNISKAGITSSTFKAVPDQPVGSFELTLPEGKYSALAANGNLCTSKLAMPTEFVAQNGLKINESTKIAVTGCAKTKSLTRAQKLKAGLKVCHKRPKGKRAGCEKAARKKYGPVKKK
jgi:hypothetical protein